ncbi:MAG: hypothetical protein NC901_02855 [Candidatus Omnitrophica bacterium]|nr:hypothetical protein [Candidatus Omnitrophota bacterium]
MDWVSIVKEIGLGGVAIVGLIVIVQNVISNKNNNNNNKSINLLLDNLKAISDKLEKISCQNYDILIKLEKLLERTPRKNGARIS